MEYGGALAGDRRLSSRDCGEDFDPIVTRDLSITRLAIQLVAVYEKRRKQPDLAIGVENEFAKAGILRVDRVDALPHRAPGNHDQALSVRRTPVTGRNVYLGHISPAEIEGSELR